MANISSSIILQKLKLFVCDEDNITGNFRPAKSHKLFYSTSTTVLICEKNTYFNAPTL